MDKEIKNLTKSKYLRFIIVLFGFFVFALLMGVFFGVLYEDLLLGFGIGAVCGAVIFLVPLCYYLISLIRLKNKIAHADKKIGTVENWKNGFFRGFGKVSLSVDANEYFSDSIFTWDEARELVGKSVSYCIIDETLIVFNLVE